jgi:hypothetical protein
MNKPNITPGPWHDHGTNRITSDKSQICAIPRRLNALDEWEAPRPEVEANAKAIAATPATLDALEKVYAYISNLEPQENIEEQDGALETVREALLNAGYWYNNANA